MTGVSFRPPRRHCLPALRQQAGHRPRRLFETFFAEEIESLALAARDAQDPWEALTHALTATVERLAAHRVLLAVAHETGAVTVHIAERYLDPLGPPLAAAQEAGQARPDLVVRDLAAILVMALSTTRMADSSAADRNRYLAILFDGIRPSPRPLPPLSRAKSQPDQVE